MERILLDESIHMLQSFESYLPLWNSLLHVLSVYPLVEAWILHPLGVELMDGTVTHIEELSDFSDTHLRPFEI
jgi:uncharacterized membrane protein YecN with MAPEG domain